MLKTVYLAWITLFQVFEYTRIKEEEDMMTTYCQCFSDMMKGKGKTRNDIITDCSGTLSHRKRKGIFQGLHSFAGN